MSFIGTLYTAYRCVSEGGCFCSVDCNRHPEGASERTHQRTIRRSARMTQKAVKHDPRRHSKPKHNFQTYAVWSVIETYQVGSDTKRDMNEPKLQ